MIYTTRELTVADLWDAQKSGVPEGEMPFFILSRIALVDGQPMTIDEFRALPVSVFNTLTTGLNMGNGQTSA